MTEEFFLSEEGYEGLEKELEGLLEDRKAITQKIKEAREYGDLSENAEYQEAKSKQSFIEGRIEEIQSMLKMATVVKSGSRKEISLGSRVRIHIDGGKMEYQIVGSNEASPQEGKISNESPIGRALLGKQKGEKLVIVTPAGEQDVTIEEIL
jgi:transcription elongation factor GreA